LLNRRLPPIIHQVHIVAFEIQAIHLIYDEIRQVLIAEGDDVVL
jgi:hypothetical protein